MGIGIPFAPRWVGALWLWLPAVISFGVFAGIAVLEAGGSQGVSWWSLAALGCAASYAARERWPVGSLVLSLAIVAAVRLPGVHVLGGEFDVVYLLLLVVPVLPLVAVSSALPTAASTMAFLTTVAVGIAVSPDPVWSTPTDTAQTAIAGLILSVGIPVTVALGAWLAGCALRSRERYVQVLGERADWLERTREAEAAGAIAGERARIAQELHDVVTHTVAVMVVQAAAADAVWDRDPDQARASLRAVEASGRTAMADLRGMLGALRPDAPVGDRQAGPGLGQLSELVEQVRAGGLSARLTVTGSASGVSAGTSLSLLRIAQESVTNVLRHAQATRLTIDLAVEDEVVRLAIADDGVGVGATMSARDRLDPDGHGGRGVVGMQERARLLGGTLAITPASGGGTVVTVSAPLERVVPG